MSWNQVSRRPVRRSNPRPVDLDTIDNETARDITKLAVGVLGLIIIGAKLYKTYKERKDR